MDSIELSQAFHGMFLSSILKSNFLNFTSLEEFHI